MRRIPPRMTQGTDGEGVCARVLGCPIILNHKNRRFQFTGVYLVPARSAEDDQAASVNPYWIS